MIAASACWVAALLPAADSALSAAGAEGFQKLDVSYYLFVDQEPWETSSASDDSHAYLNVGVGLTSTDDSDSGDQEVDFDEGWGIPIALGYHWDREAGRGITFDAEIEAVYTDQDAESDVQELTVFGVLLNGIVNVPVSHALGVYGGAGIGMGWLDVSTGGGLDGFEEEDGPFLAWQAKAGLRWWSSDSVSWNVGYRFLNVDDAELDDDASDASFDLETRQHMLEIGVRFRL